MALPHGSQLPQPFEGFPFHNDNFQISFTPVANGVGTLVSIGSVVTVAATPDEACEVTHTINDFMLGVALTSGQLNPTIDVLVRGVAQVYVDDNVAAGTLLWPSAAHDGMMGLGAGATAVSRVIAIQSINGAVTPALCLVLIF